MKDPWVIFDADNTLWDVEKLYDDARTKLCNYLNERGVSKVDAKEFQRVRDAELYNTYGYSACRFARPFEDTAINFLGISESSDVIIHCRSIALEVFERTPVCDEELEKIFSSLKGDPNLTH